ncbi:MAG: hypothetical protein RL434_1417 [Pseudomonadota bacterium]
MSTFPKPVPDYGSEPFWAGCNEGVLRFQRCAACQKLRWHPAPICTYCQAEDCAWETIPGTGRIHTWTVITHPVHPGAVGKVPYVVVEIALDAQSDLRMISRLVECAPDEVTMAAPVEVVFEAHPDGQQLPLFRLRR